MWLEPEMELTLKGTAQIWIWSQIQNQSWSAHDLRSDIDGTGAGAAVYPKTVEQKYGFRAGSRSQVNPPHDLRLDIDGTWARDGVDPKFRSKCYNPNMDLELDPEPELTPHTWSIVINRCDWSQRWSWPSKGTTQICIWSCIRGQNVHFWR